MEASGISAWGYSGASISKVTGRTGRVLHMAWSSGSFPLVNQIGIFTVGKTYHFSGYARSDGTTVPRIKTEGTTTIWTGTNSKSWQRFDFMATVLGPDLDLIFTASSASYVEWDDIFVTEYTATINPNLNRSLSFATPRCHRTRWLIGGGSQGNASGSVYRVLCGEQAGG